MTDDYRGGLERIAYEHLEETMNSQAEQVAFTLSPHREIGIAESYTAKVVGSLALNIVAHEHLFGRVPVQIDARHSNSERNVNFDVPTFDDLCEQVCDNYNVTARDIAMLYVGGGLALQLLEERVGINSQKVERLWTIMKNPSGLDLAIVTNSWFTEEENYVLRNAAMNIDSEDRIAHINALRFALGIVFMQGEEIPLADPIEAIQESYQHRVAEQFRNGMRSQIHTKGEYARTLRAFGRSEATIDRNFSENIPEIGFAACFPMRIPEMADVLRVTL